MITYTIIDKLEKLIGKRPYTIYRGIGGKGKKEGLYYIIRTSFRNAPLNWVKLSSSKKLHQAVYRACYKLLKMRGGETI